MNNAAYHTRPRNFRFHRLLKASAAAQRQDFESLRRKVEREMAYWVGHRYGAESDLESGLLRIRAPGTLRNWRRLPPLLSRNRRSPLPPAWLV